MRWLQSTAGRVRMPAVSHVPVASQRMFSASAAALREFAHVVRRRQKQPLQFAVGDPDTLLPAQPPKYPVYPYGPADLYKQSNRGLYGGKMPQFGNKVSEKFKQKSGRVFRPNVQRVSLWSEALKRTLRIRLVTSVLRTITKEGGLDNYLTKDSSARVKELGPFGWRLRYDVLQRVGEHERTQPQPIEGLSVGKARLIKDLYTKTAGAEGTLKEYRLKYRDQSGAELLRALEQRGVDTAVYKRAEL